MKSKSSPKVMGILAVFVVALGGGATYFQYQHVQKAKARVAELDAQVPSQKDLERDLSETSSQLVAYQKQLDHLEGNVPDVAYIPTMLKELEAIGKSHRIVVTAVRPAPQQAAPKPLSEEGSTKPAKKDYAEIDIEVKGRGRYDDVKALLDSLQKFPKVIAVKTVALSPIRDLDSGTKDQIEITINVTAFVFPYEFIAAQAGKSPNAAQPPTQPATDAQPPVQSAPANQSRSTFTESTETMRLAKKGGK